MISAQRMINASTGTQKGETGSSSAVIAGQSQGIGSNTCLTSRPSSLDAQGFDAFYREQHGLIYGYVYHKVGNLQEAEDLTSSIFLKAVRSLQPEGGPARMHHWLLRVASTTIIDYWRSQARVRSSSLEVLQEAGWEGPSECDPFGVDGRSTERVQRLLESLSERDRAVLTCRFLLGLSTRETAVRMGLTEGNVKAVQRRALKRAAALDAG
jgi:RNA polymerase sigma-70 factor (ECF subfamily)